MYSLIAIFFAAALGAAPETATLTGIVRLSKPGAPIEHATVSIVQLRRSAETDADGRFVLANIAPGEYDVVAHMHAMNDQTRRIRLEAGRTATLDFNLSLGVVHQEITVTASGREQTALETFQAVTAIDSLELSTKQATSLGEVVDGQPGASKRSFGPGTTRPVIRGFDGDRVLVLQDGLPTGTISSQSGDHGEPLNAGSVDQVEIVKGPATLLYGSTAIGGVVNVITGHHQVHEHAHEGVRGYLTGNAGSGNAYAGGAGGFEYGRGRWLISGDGGAARTGDYSTPLGPVQNSRSRLSNVFGSAAHYGGRNLFGVNYGVQDGNYGVPFGAELSGEEVGNPNADITLAFRRQQVRANFGHGGFIGPLERFDLQAAYTDWTHKELEGAAIGTRFFNKQLMTRGAFEQRRKGRLAGRFGFWGMARDYNTVGAERLSPPVDLRAAAAFALEEVDFERLKLQFGGRYEHNGYAPAGALARSFNGFSGAAGVNFALWNGGALALNYTRSYRAPALEELYNFGPHTGNLTFEIGDAALRREAGNGLDVSLRHQGARARAELNLFYYRLADFVYLAPTGRIAEGLIEARYAQADARYMGAEAHTDVRLLPDVWLHLGFDAVDAQLRQSRVPLPRIPPARGRVALDFHKGDFGLRPELVLSNAQGQLFPTETRTAGYAVANVAASYNRAVGHALNVFSFELFNASDRLYRNHLSFIKDLAPEIGRGVKLTYTVRFF